VPNRLDTKFNLGSMNKMFTAVVIAQLAEEGKLAFGDPIGKHLTDYANKEVAEKVRIHHLLTHTSGVGDYFNEQFMTASRDRFRTVRDFFPLFVERPLEFTPGERFRYSNAGFLLLGAIIEKLTGKSYFDAVQERLYRRAGMTNTDAYEMDRDTPNLAIGYTWDGVESPSDGPRNNLFMHVIKGGPAGGGFSTVEDLLRFDQALRRHRLLGPKQTELLLTGKVKPNPARDSEYGYGFFVEKRGGQRIVGHGGGFPGISAALDIYLDSSYTVAVLSNDDGGARHVSAKLRTLIAGGI
jgi:CubicO group peptidase (beta-lactamase class C family)